VKLVGEVAMQVGGVAMQVGGVAMQVGEVAMQVGEVVMQVGEVVMQVGEVVMQVGEVVMQVGGVVKQAGGVVKQVGGVAMPAGGVVMRVGEVVKLVGDIASTMPAGYAQAKNSLFPSHRLLVALSHGSECTTALLNAILSIFNPSHFMQTPIQPQQLLAQLNWRYATKQFDPARKISPEHWAALEEVLRLTPSSFGLQPWKFIVVADPALRAKLAPASWGQTQITDASHLVVLAAKNELGEPEVDAFLAHAAQSRGVAVEALADYRGLMLGKVVHGMDDATRNAWARNQAYIALGNLLTSAALLGIDACPIEGFDRAQYDEILGLKALGYSSAVVAALGYRLLGDKYASAPKVRFPKEQLFVAI
jgi:nitroreductase